MPLVLLTMMSVVVQCRDPYRDLDLELAWSNEIYKKYGKDIRCERGPSAVYLQDLVADILKIVSVNPYQFRVCITGQKQLNAFALPGGYLFFHRGLLESMESEDELAFVVAHEMSHVLLRHSFRMQRSLNREHELSGRVKTNTLRIPLTLFGSLGLLKYNRHFEKKADLNGLKLIAAAGFDPRGAEKTLEILRRNNFIRPRLLQQLLSTHPRPEARLRYIRRTINRMAPGKDYRKSSKKFKNLKRIYGSPL